MIGWLKSLFASEPVDGEEGRARGYRNARKAIRDGLDERGAAEMWANADHLHNDDYDRGVLDALADSGFKDPSAMDWMETK